MKIFYRLTLACSRFLFSILYHHQVYGKSHIPSGPCILAPNHASFFDPPIVACSCPDEICFLAKGALFKNVIFQKIISALNAYPVTGTIHDTESLKAIIHLVKDKNKKVVIFPEGTRTENGEILPIKPGICMLVSRCECPIVPVYIHGTYAAWPRTRLFPKPWGKTACVFGSPIYWDTFKDLPKKKAHEEMANSIQKSLILLQSWYTNGAVGSPP